VLQRDFEFPDLLVTVNEVEVTQDLKEAKVWVGVLGGDPAGIIERLKRQHGFIQNKVMKRVILKSTPVLDFRIDDSAARGVDIVRLLEEIDQLPTAPRESEPPAAGG
jgi:ribosome-binding factor A